MCQWEEYACLQVIMQIMYTAVLIKIRQASLFYLTDIWSMLYYIKMFDCHFKCQPWTFRLINMFLFISLQQKALYFLYFFTALSMIDDLQPFRIIIYQLAYSQASYSPNSLNQKLLLLDGDNGKSLANGKLCPWVQTWCKFLSIPLFLL